MAVPQRPPRRARYLVPLGLPRRAEILAALALLALVASALLVPLILLLTLAFHAVSRVSRWRPVWLAVPAGCGAVWLLAIGPGAAFRASGTALSQAASLITNPGTLARIPAAQAHSVAAQVPVALILAAVAAAVAWWLRWLHTDEWDLPATRPGLASRWRRRVTVASVRRGGVVTRTGACLGADRVTGRPAALSWREAGAGVLVTGAVPGAVQGSGLQLAHAAIRRRKPVVVVDLAGSRELPGMLAAVCAASAAPLGVFGAEGALFYKPVLDDLAARGLTDEDLAALRASPLGRMLGPGTASAARIGVADVVRRRAVALFVLDRPRYGRAAEVVANLVAADVAAGYAGLARSGIPAEGLVWFTECEGTDPQALAPLAAPGSQPGLVPVLATTAPRAAASLAGHVNVGVFHRLADRNLAAELAALTGARLMPLSRVPAGQPVPDGAGTSWTAALGAVPLGTTPAPVLPAEVLCELADDEFVLVTGLAEARACGVALPGPGGEGLPGAGGPALAGGVAQPGVNGAASLNGGARRAGLDTPGRDIAGWDASGRGASGWDTGAGGDAFGLDGGAPTLAGGARHQAGGARRDRFRRRPAITVLARCQAVPGRLPPPPPAPPNPAAHRGPAARRST